LWFFLAGTQEVGVDPESRPFGNQLLTIRSPARRFSSGERGPEWTDPERNGSTLAAQQNGTNGTWRASADAWRAAAPGRPCEQGAGASISKPIERAAGLNGGVTESGLGRAAHRYLDR
jgi:hypothetical protein